MASAIDGARTRRELNVNSEIYDYYSLAAAEAMGLAGVSRLPYSLKVVLENVLRQHAEGTLTTARHRRRGGLARTRAAQSAKSPSSRRAC